MFKLKKSTYILSAILTLSLLASCGSSDLTVTNSALKTGMDTVEAMIVPEGTDMIGGTDYSTGKRLSYLERNRLQIDTVSGSNGSTYYYAVSSISGLTDEHTASAVNERLTTVAETWCTGRPLPDASLAETLSKDVIRNACYGASTVITLSCSDYLSGIAARTIDFYDPETLTHSLLTYDYPINFDLRSGEELSLAALFCDGTEYMKIINSEIVRYAKDKALPMKNFSGIPETCVFSLSENGLIIYIDDSYGDIGLPAGTVIPIDYSAFGDALVIERPCGDIYTEKESAGFKLLRNSKSSEATVDTVYFDEGDKLSVKISHTSPAGFPQTLFEEADKFIAEYIPDDTAAAKIRESESDFLRLSCSISGYYIGSCCCVDLSCTIKQSGEAAITAVRSYVYDTAGNEVTADKIFSEDFDANAYVSGLLATSVTALMDEGWTIEGEVDVTDIDFSLGSESISFSTLPARMSRKTVGADGTEQNETRRASITAEASFEEIGFAELLLTGR